MSQILTNIESILKDKYLPALTDMMATEPSPFFEMIRKEPLQNNKVRAVMPRGMNGGFGFGAEGAATPKAAEQRYLDFEVKAVDMYVDMQISNKTIVLGSSNTSAMVNALDAEIKSSYAAAKWHLNRALFGDGSGILAKAEPATFADTTMTVDNTNALRVGMCVDVYTEDEGTPKKASSLRIVALDREAGTVTFDRALSYTTEANSFLTVQGSYGRELCGLGAVFAEGGSLYGVDRATTPEINPLRIDLENELSDLALYRGIREADKYRGANINLIMMGDGAFEQYQAYMDTHHTHLVDKHKFVGGATGYSILVGDREVIIVNESFVPQNEAWGVDTESFILQQTPWEFLSNQGSIFSLQADSSIYRALLASYGNLICTNPGGCVQFKNCGAN